MLRISLKQRPAGIFWLTFHVAYAIRIKFLNGDLWKKWTPVSKIRDAPGPGSLAILGTEYCAVSGLNEAARIAVESPEGARHAAPEDLERIAGNAAQTLKWLVLLLFRSAVPASVPEKPMGPPAPEEGKKERTKRRRWADRRPVAAKVRALKRWRWPQSRAEKPIL